VNLDDVRRLTPGAREYAYFQTSGFAPKPEPVLDEVVRWLRFQAQGPALPFVLQAMAEKLEETRARAARSLNADPDEIALNENTTTGVNVVAHGVDWRPGDAVVLTTHEHPGNRIPWYTVARRHGVALRFVDGDLDDERFLAQLGRSIDACTRIVSISHVSRLTGRRFPARAAVDLAHLAGVPILLDGAQAFGAIPADVRALGCDFYAFAGHKYVWAPRAPAGSTCAATGSIGCTPAGSGPIPTARWTTSAA